MQLCYEPNVLISPVAQIVHTEITVSSCPISLRLPFQTVSYEQILRTEAVLESGKTWRKQYHWHSPPQQTPCMCPLHPFLCSLASLLWKLLHLCVTSSFSSPSLRCVCVSIISTRAIVYVSPLVVMWASLLPALCFTPACRWPGEEAEWVWKSQAAGNSHTVWKCYSGETRNFLCLL